MFNRRSISLARSRSLLHSLRIPSDVEDSTNGPVSVASARVFFWMCLGFALVVSADAAGRNQSALAPLLFWVGQFAAYGAAFIRALNVNVSNAERRGVVLFWALGQSLLTYAYSPIVFKFPDELQHWRTASDIVSSGHLFGSNPILPVSPEFPGLEIVTSYVARIAHLSLFDSGLIVVTISHIFLAATVYSLYAALVKNTRIAAIAALLYGIVPHGFMFNALFLYGAIALPFFVLSVRASLNAKPKSVSWSATLLGGLCLAVTVVSHPLTALISIAVVLGLGILAAFHRATALARQCLIVGLTGVVLAGLWVIHYASDVPSYLGGPLTTLWKGLSEGGASGGKVAVAATQPSPIERLFVMGSVGVTAVLIPLGVLAWRRTAISTQVKLFLLGALAFYGIIAVRVLDADGAELATRGLTYVALFSSLPLAAVLVALWAHKKSKAIVLLLGGLLLAGNICAGWPPSWERLPGTFHVDAFESGIDGNSLLVTTWSLRTLGPNAKVACDFSDCSLIAGLAGQYPVGDASAIYYANTITPDVAHDAAVLNVQYLVVDQRISSQLPVTGGYLEKDPQQDEHLFPVDQSALAKFDANPDISRIYDSGVYQVYDMRGLWHG